MCVLVSDVAEDSASRKGTTRNNDGRRSAGRPQVSGRGSAACGANDPPSSNPPFAFHTHSTHTCGGRDSGRGLRRELLWDS